MSTPRTAGAAATVMLLFFACGPGTPGPAEPTPNQPGEDGAQSAASSGAGPSTPIDDSTGTPVPPR